MLFYNPITRQLSKNKKPSKIIDADGNIINEIMIPELPETTPEIYDLENINIKNVDGTYGEWVLNLDKMKNYYLEVIKNKWLLQFTLPLDTAHEFQVQQGTADLSLWRDGLLNVIRTYASNNPTEFTEEELSDLSMGILRGSAYEKCKTQTMSVRAYDNLLYTVTLEEAKNIAELMATAINNNFYKKWTIQQTIKNATTSEEILTAVESW